MERGSGQGSVAPRYPSLLAGRHSSSPPTPGGTELHPAGPQLMLTQVQAASPAPHGPAPVPVQLVSRPTAPRAVVTPSTHRPHTAAAIHPRQSRWDPLGLSLPQGFVPAASIFQSLSHSLSQSSSDALLISKPISSQLPGNSSRQRLHKWRQPQISLSLSLSLIRQT